MEPLPNPNQVNDIAPDTVQPGTYSEIIDPEKGIGSPGSPAYISPEGAATFENISIGGSTTQYKISDFGIFSFGDGSDGDLSTTGDVTLTRDTYYKNLTVNVGHTLNPAGYRIFVQQLLIVYGTISGAGNAGTDGGDGSNGVNGAGTVGGGSAGVGGAALADGYLKGSLAGKNGAAGGVGGSGAAGTNGSNGIAGTNTLNSLGSNAGTGGNGGTGGDATNPAGARGGGVGAAGGTITASNVKLIANWHLATLLDISSTGSTVKFDNSASPGSGGSGGGGNSNVAARGGGGGGSGGSGSPGRILAIYARSITLATGGIITVAGGRGGDGGDGGDGYSGAAPTGGGGGGGGGAGANGGILVLSYNTMLNKGTLDISGGTGGTGGAAGLNNGAGSATSAGTDGADGSPGVLYQFQISI